MSARDPIRNGEGLPGRPGSRQDSPRSVFAGSARPDYGTNPGSDGSRQLQPPPAPRPGSPSFQSWLDARIMTADLPWMFVLVAALVISGILLFGMPSDSPPRRRVDLTRTIVLDGSGHPPARNPAGGGP